jgi:stringent starvation protein B
MTGPMLPAKRDVFRALIQRGSVFVHVDPRKAGVYLPDRLRLQAQVVLQWGLDMPVPIPDMKADDDGISGTLSFKGVPFLCNIPWDAVFAVVGEDAKGMVWPEVMPAEIKTQVERENRKAASHVGQVAEVVRFDSSAPRKNSSARVSARPGADRSFLRVVK